MPNTLLETLRTHQLQSIERIVMNIPIAAIEQGQNQTFGGF
jgi:hypothetical protein